MGAQNWRNEVIGLKGNAIEEWIIISWICMTCFFQNSM